MSIFGDNSGNQAFFDAANEVPNFITYCEDYNVHGWQGVPCGFPFHFISSPKSYYEQHFGNGRIDERFKDMASQDRIKNILTTQIIYGNPKGYLVNKNLSEYGLSQKDICSVSFGVYDSGSINFAIDRRGSEFAIVFTAKFLNKVKPQHLIHIKNKNLDNITEYINKNRNNAYLIDIENPKYDFKEENEYRIKECLPFSFDDIAFIMVPNKFNCFNAGLEKYNKKTFKISQFMGHDHQLHTLYDDSSSKLAYNLKYDLI